jgi:hypothetical protein
MAYKDGKSCIVIGNWILSKLRSKSICIGIVQDNEQRESKDMPFRVAASPNFIHILQMFMSHKILANMEMWASHLFNVSLTCHGI